MGGEKEGDGRGFVAAARRSGLYVARRKRKRKSSEAGSERGGRRKEELGAATGRIGRPASSARLWGPQLLTSPHIYTSVRSQDEADRSEFAASWQLWWSGSRAGQDDKGCCRIVVAGTCPHSTRTAHTEQRRTGSGSDRRRYQPRIGDGSPSWTKRALVEAASGSGSCSTWAWAWREGAPRKVAVCVWNVADVAVCTMLV